MKNIKQYIKLSKKITLLDCINKNKNLKTKYLIKNKEILKLIGQNINI